MQVSYDTFLNDLNEIITKESIAVAKGLDEAEIAGLGKKTSYTYRTKLMSLLKQAEMTPTDKVMLMVLCNSIKNRSRLLEAMRIFEGKGTSWYDRVKKFLTEKVTQSPRDAGADKIAIVNIPSCMPELSVFCFCITHTFKDENDAFQKLINTLLVPQFEVDTEVLSHAKTAEKHFWENVVVKRAHHKNFEAGFHEDYFETKAKDNYLFVRLNAQGKMEVYPHAGTHYTVAEIKKYLKENMKGNS
jgi:hypothetical protein